jgi:hypothetical protein
VEETALRKDARREDQAKRSVEASRRRKEDKCNSNEECFCTSTYQYVPSMYCYFLNFDVLAI